jgi:hypothetical protein
MFVDKDENKYLSDGQTLFFDHRIKAVALIISAFIILGISVAVIYFNFQKKPIVADPLRDDPAINATTTINGKLPGLAGDNGKQDRNSSSTLSNLRAEEISFGDFFKIEHPDIVSNIKKYAFPINVKTDTYNYYDLARKIDLEPYLDSLNNYGFAIADNPFGKNANDFYAFNQTVISKEIPIVLTGDFLVYYYQSILKKVYKDIEKNVFFDNLWTLSKAMYDKSSTRYRKNFFDKGIINDAGLEAQRLEASFFAIALELLKPQDFQINRILNFDDDAKFSEQQADQYSYILQDFLREDIAYEIALIKEAKQTKRSNILLYDIDYRVFAVPAEYKASARLYNFYLASKWLESLFPLYYKSAECPDCALDINDWSINMSAAALISADLYDDQKIKNEWANIYKFLSYFKGLRQDLTYLDYHSEYYKQFTDNPEFIFAKDNVARMDDLKVYQSRLMQETFSELEGGYERNIKNYNKIGMRLLQENYWPNDFIFKYLSGPELKYAKTEEFEKTRAGGCANSENKIVYRCLGTAKEILNLVYPIAGDQYIEAADYFSGYKKNYDYLRELVGDFTVYSWHKNNYWSTLDIINKDLNQIKTGLPPYMAENEWLKKEINMGLGMWANIHLPNDELIPNPDKTIVGFVYEDNCAKNSLIEPNLLLVENLLANVSMLAQMMEATNLTRKTNVNAIDMTDMLDNLQKIKDIVVKELQDDGLVKSDCDFIRDFAQQYALSKDNINSFQLRFSSKLSQIESLKGVKALIVANGDDKNKSLLIGPIFNYREENKN